MCHVQKTLFMISKKPKGKGKKKNERRKASYIGNFFVKQNQEDESSRTRKERGLGGLSPIFNAMSLWKISWCKGDCATVVS